jgi:serine/threonine-protein kinase
MTDRFERLEQLGRGGMAVVWKARDRESGELVALKVLHSHFAEDPDYIARFEREVEVTQRIDSPNAVKILGYGSDGGDLFLTMEYIDGQSLRELLHSRGKLPWEETKAIAEQVAAGLKAAHEKGVIHRDIKPSNIMLASDGIARLADFGIARLADMTRLTGSSTMLGTPLYMAPDTETDVRSDLYSLGVVLYEMLAGEPPFPGPSQAAIMMGHLKGSPDITRVPAEARGLLRRLLAKDPASRPSSAGEVLALLQTNQTGEHSRLPLALGRRRLTLAAVAIPLVGALIGIGVTLSWTRSGETVGQGPPSDNGATGWTPYASPTPVSTPGPSIVPEPAVTDPTATVSGEQQGTPGPSPVSGPAPGAAIPLPTSTRAPEPAPPAATSAATATPSVAPTTTETPTPTATPTSTPFPVPGFPVPFPFPNCPVSGSCI